MNVNNPGETLKPEVKALLAPLFELVRAKHEAANRSFLESNKFEFDVCKLLLQGAGGAFLLYFGSLKYINPDHKISLTAISAWALSLFCGITHLLLWSYRQGVIGEKEMETAGLIMKEMENFSTIDAPQKLLAEIAKEELNRQSKILKQKTPESKFRFTVARKKYNYWLIVLQLGLLFVGFIAALHIPHQIIYY